ncbi:LysR family transcriptional regulator [Rhodoferax koreense]|uniref:LysR family transcriptional regulator n=1 Tax=Rhodoferax koreensis TaxID=1842727 RepID=UPI0009F91858|nr:LysR family transcriptional regulator [Rhodoferax koreense]
MSIDRFRAMEVFSRVVELGSFSGAAAALHLPKGRVTTIVQELEAHLGVRLLHRTTRRIGLTDDGAVYHQRAMAMVQEVLEVEGSLRRAVAAPVGRLRVDVPAYVGRHIIAPALPQFFARYPDMQLELGSTDRPVDLIAEGVDCVVRGGPVHDETLVARPLLHWPQATCAAPSYLARHGTPRTLEDLAQHRFVNFHSAKTGRIFAFEFSKDGERHEIHRPHWVSCNDADSAIEAVLAGMGLAQLPRTRWLSECLADGRLVPVLQGWSAGHLPLMVLYPRNRHLTAKVRVFADWVAEVFEAEVAATLPAPVVQTPATGTSPVDHSAGLSSAPRISSTKRRSLAG